MARAIGSAGPGWIAVRHSGGSLDCDRCLRLAVGLTAYALRVATLTFVFTDIEGSTALLRRVGADVYARILADHHSLIRSALAGHDGTELNTLGDGFFAAFSSPSACVAAVLEMQRALQQHDWPQGERVRVRMGVHTGEATQTPAGLLGLDVHRAARVAGVASGGQILLSETTAALVRDSLPAGAELRDLGLHRLKDLGRPEQVFQLDAAGLPTEFPPLRSLDNPALPNNLPVQLTTFIGREREMAEVRALVGSSRLVTLTGAGGSGKTRLGLQVAAELLDGTSDGVWLVELAAVTAEEAVPQAICAAIGIVWRPDRPVLETMVDALAHQQVLIVLDNCEHLISGCAKTADAILRRCPRVQLMATSREPLGIGGETIYRVPSLSLPDPKATGVMTPESSDAVALLLDRAKEQGVEVPVDQQTGPLIALICRQLDGMPLAIELAAARLRSLSLSDLRDRLDQRFHLLTGGSRTALPRQQTLEATVDWSYSLLTAAERQLLRRLSVFAEGFDLAAAEAVCGFGDIEVFEVTELLGSLVDKSLVVAEQAGGEVRYRLLETIRQFAGERLTQAGQDAASVAAAHSEYYLSVAERAAPYLTGPDQGSWFRRLDTDRANLRRAVRHAAGDPHGTARVLRFGVALQRYWMAREIEEEARELLLPVLERPDARADPRLFGAASITVIDAIGSNDRAAARRLGELTVELARQFDDDRLLIESLSLLCGGYYFSGEPEKGLPLGEEAVERARRLGDDVLLAAALMHYLLASDLIDPVRSEQLFAEAIACAERTGDRLVTYNLHNNLGVHALRAGDISAARAHLEQAAAIMTEIGEKSHHVTVNLGWVLRQENDIDGARAKFQAGLRISLRNGERVGVAYSSLGLACVAADEHDWYRAAEVHGAAQAFLDRTAGEPWQEPEARYRRESLDELRAQLGAEQLDRAYGAGNVLGFDDALELVLGRVSG
jgi:predicted ATPase/class 3 adenylate cyclase/Tfp pilus assembly protein PilF